MTSMTFRKVLNFCNLPLRLARLQYDVIILRRRCVELQEQYQALMRTNARICEAMRELKKGNKPPFDLRN